MISIFNPKPNTKLKLNDDDMSTLVSLGLDADFDFKRVTFIALTKKKGVPQIVSDAAGDATCQNAFQWNMGKNSLEAIGF